MFRGDQIFMNFVKFLVHDYLLSFINMMFKVKHLQPPDF